MSTIIIGIDPGKKGALCFLPGESGAPVTAHLMPLYASSADPTDIDAKAVASIITRELESRKQRAVACVEEVFARARQAGQTTFIRGYGKLIGVLEVLDIPYVLVTPQTWKKHVLGRAYSHTDKLGTISWARRTYPDFNLTPPGKRVPSDGLADSLAIAHYGAMQIAGPTPLIRPL